MNTHELCGRPPAALATLLVAVLATFAAGAAYAQGPARKPVKWVVSCPAPRAAATPDSAPAAALAVPDPVESLVAGLGPSPVVPAPALVPTAAPGPASPTGPAAAPAVHLAAVDRPSQGREAVPATAGAAPPAPVFLVASVPRWEVLTSDMTLSKTLARWAQDAGYRLQWDAPRNFLIGAPTGFSGDFETAVSALLSTPGIRLSEFPLEACLYGNSPPLLRITRYGEQARECAAANPATSRTATLP